MSKTSFQTTAGGVLLLCSVFGGCQGPGASTAKPAPKPTTNSPAPIHSTGGNVKVDGAVNFVGSMTIPPTGLTLGAVIDQAGVVIPKQSPSWIGLFARLSRSDGDHYFALPVCQFGPASGVYLNSGDSITIVDWTATDLARGLTLLKNFPPIPPFTGDPNKLTDLLDWSIQASPDIVKSRPRAIKEIEDLIAADSTKDAAVKMQEVFVPSPPTGFPPNPFDISKFKDHYVAVLQKKLETLRDPPVNWEPIKASIAPQELSRGSHNLQLAISGPGGPIEVAPDKTRITFPNSSNPMGQIPRLKSLAASAQTNANSSNVVVLRRIIKGRNTEFIFPSINRYGTSSFVPSVMDNIVAFDGDQIQVIDPARVPIVMASLIAPVVSPNATAADREKAMCCLRNCINSNKPADKCVGVCPINSTSAAKPIASSTVPVLPSTQVPVLVPTPESVPAPAPILPTVPKP